MIDLIIRSLLCYIRWTAVFLGRLPRIKESISRDPIFKDPHFRLEDTLQNNITTLAILSGNILRDMYFLPDPSLNICRQRKSELENWMYTLSIPLQQHIESGNVPESPKDQSEAIFNLHFMHLGAWILVTRPFLWKALKMKTSSNFGGPIVSVISSEANLCIKYASRLINSATLLLGSALTPKRSIMPVFFLINAAYIMIVATVWERKQFEGVDNLSSKYGKSDELATIDASIQVLELCGQRNSFARRYLVQIKDLRQQLALFQSSEASSNFEPFTPSVMSSSTSATDSNQVAENPPSFENLAIASDQNLAFSSRRDNRSILSTRSSGPGSSLTDSSPGIDFDGWPSSQFEALSTGNTGFAHNFPSSFSSSPDDFISSDFWDRIGE